MGIGVIIIGDEILSGRRSDKHLSKIIEILAARGLTLDWAQYVGDDRERITATLKRSFAGSDIVFSTGGIGATPDDHTRQCAAAALGVPIELHPEARDLIIERMRIMAREKLPAELRDSPAVTHIEPDLSLPENAHRLHMGEFPQGAQIIPNGYNKIPGFSVHDHHFVPGFPVMAWPMIEWVLDNRYPHMHHQDKRSEKSFLVFGLMESAVTPLMEKIEREFTDVRAFSLPSVGDAERGEIFRRRHIDLGVKGAPEQVEAAFTMLTDGVLALGGEIVNVPDAPKVPNA